MIFIYIYRECILYVHVYVTITTTLTRSDALHERQHKLAALIAYTYIYVHILYRSVYICIIQDYVVCDLYEYIYIYKYTHIAQTRSSRAWRRWRSRRRTRQRRARRTTCAFAPECPASLVPSQVLLAQPPTAWRQHQRFSQYGQYCWQ